VFASLLQEGTVPDTRLKLRHGDVLVVDSLAGAVQLSAMRRTLAEGFQAHLQVGPDADHAQNSVHSLQ
jgi:hypothetical protein